MRKEWTAGERVALDAVVQALAHEVFHDPTVPLLEGAPDALFVIDDVRIAVECRYLVRSEIMELLGRRAMPPDKVYEIYLPREPHLWVSEAIKEKHEKIEQYKTVAQADEAWLVLHSSELPSFPDDISQGKGLDMLELMKYAAASEPHSFSKIWFSHIANGASPAIPIYGDGVAPSTVSPDEYFDRYKPSYPIDTYWYGGVQIVDDENGGTKVGFNLNTDIADYIYLQPLNKKCRIDYSPQPDHANRNSNLSGLSVTVKKDRPAF